MGVGVTPLRAYVRCALCLGFAVLGVYVCCMEFASGRCGLYGTLREYYNAPSEERLVWCDREDGCKLQDGACPDADLPYPNHLLPYREANASWTEPNTTTSVTYNIAAVVYVNIDTCDFMWARDRDLKLHVTASAGLGSYFGFMLGWVAIVYVGYWMGVARKWVAHTPFNIVSSRVAAAVCVPVGAATLAVIWALLLYVAVEQRGWAASLRHGTCTILTGPVGTRRRHGDGDTKRDVMSTLCDTVHRLSGVPSDALPGDTVDCDIPPDCTASSIDPLDASYYSRSIAVLAIVLVLSVACFVCGIVGVRRLWRRRDEVRVPDAFSAPLIVTDYPLRGESDEHIRESHESIGCVLSHDGWVDVVLEDRQSSAGTCVMLWDMNKTTVVDD
eukprot:TRINITY_DN1961_c0_g1_i1.p1 TRINITY_DN1961_c0_g1~~TRINITY_DN1961_c0_g1_i1.p1  ORF type:complete len:387 (+),score=15.28 TRINITY_DN1961_c0_g1_i1:139-1299(+)